MKLTILPVLLAISFLVFSGCDPLSDRAAGHAVSSPAPETAAAPERAPSAPEQIATVAGLPIEAQFSDEELAEILATFKVAEPDIAVDPSRGERLDCKNCYLLLKGRLLTPPFYLTRENDKLYVNGYQVFPDNTPSFGNKGSAKSIEQKMPQLNNYHDPDEGNEVCEESENKIEIIIDAAFKFKNKKRMEHYIRSEFKKNKIKLIELKKCDQTLVQVVTQAYTCKEPSEYGAEGPAAADSGLNAIQQRMPEPIELCAGLFHRGLRDGNVFYPLLFSTYSYGSFNSYAVNGDFLPRLKAIFKDNVDPRVKLYRLQLLLSDAIGSRYLLANYRVDMH